MPSYRCSDCGIAFPSRPSFNKCPIHDEPTTWHHESPDEDWEIQLAILKEQLEPAAPESLDDLIPLVDTKVIIRPGGAYFVHAWDVYASVQRRLKPMELFRVGKQTFEVLEYMEEPREYWVRPFSTMLSEEDLARLVVGN